MSQLFINNYKKYWFYIDSHVHISTEQDNTLLYDLLSGKALEFNNNKKIKTLISKLDSEENMRVIEVSGEYILESKSIFNLINEIKNSFMGDIIDKSYSSSKPIQLHPLPKIHNSYEILTKIKEKNIGKNVLQNLHDLTLYINSKCNNNCSGCKNMHKQFTSCSKNLLQNSELSFEKIDYLLKQVHNSYMDSISISGGNILLHSDFLKIVSKLNDTPYYKTYYINYLNFFNNFKKLINLNFIDSIINILVPHEFDEKSFKDLYSIISQKLLANYQFTFIIDEFSSYEKTNNIIDELNINQYVIKPYFSGENLGFFKKCVFIKKDDLLNLKIKSKHIYTNEFINTNNFGKLIIKNNGDIFANINQNSVGNIVDTTIYEAIYKTIKNGKSWRFTRKEVKPCNKCLYKSLCPPISDYEIYMGQYNLCNK